MRQVRVTYHWEPEGSWAESPDAPEFTAAGETLSEVQELAKEGLAFHFEEPVQLVESFPSIESFWSITDASKTPSASQTKPTGGITSKVHPVPTPRLNVNPEMAFAGSSHSQGDQS